MRGGHGGDRVDGALIGVMDQISIDRRRLTVNEDVVVEEIVR